MTRRSLLATLLVIPAILAGAWLASVDLQAQKFDLTGEWVFDVVTEAGGGSPSFVFKQTGEKLAGKYKGAFGEADLTGTVTGKTMKFSFNADAQGTAITVVYEGEIESNSSVKGKVDLGGVGSGTFTGKRVK
jgi:hypothetical protein